jgi:hypothetical protein
VGQKRPFGPGLIRPGKPSLEIHPGFFPEVRLGSLVMCRRTRDARQSVGGAPRRRSTAKERIRVFAIDSRQETVDDSQPTTKHSKDPSFGPLRPAPDIMARQRRRRDARLSKSHGCDKQGQRWHLQKTTARRPDRGRAKGEKRVAAFFGAQRRTCGGHDKDAASTRQLWLPR